MDCRHCWTADTDWINTVEKNSSDSPFKSRLFFALNVKWAEGGMAMPTDCPEVDFAVVHMGKGKERKMPAEEGSLEIAKTKEGVKDSRTS